MKLNFSIDVILGTCSDASKKQQTERKRSIRDEPHPDNFYTTPGNFTVEWKPPFQKRIKTEFENPLTQPSTSEYRFPFMPNFIPSAKTKYPAAANPVGLNEESFRSDFSNVGCNVNVRVSGGVERSKNTLNNSFSSECHSSSDDSEIESRLSGARLNSSDLKNSSTDSEPKQASKRGSSRVGRRLFTGFQILELETAFSMKTYLTRTERAYLAQKVNLTECQIKTWFQNRRTKEKRRGPCSDDDVIASDDVTTSSVTYQSKTVRVPGHGIQVRPTYGPPDRHLHAAIMDFLKRKSCEEITVS